MLLPMRAGIDRAGEGWTWISAGKLASVPDALLPFVVTAMRRDRAASGHGMAVRPFDSSIAGRNAGGPAIPFNTGLAVFVRFSTN